MSTVIDQSAFLNPATLIDLHFPIGAQEHILPSANTPIAAQHRSTPSFDATTTPTQVLVSAVPQFDVLGSGGAGAETILDLEKQQQHHLQQFLYFQSLAIQKQELAIKQQKEFEDLVNSFGAPPPPIDHDNTCTASATSPVDPVFLASNDLIFTEDSALSVPALSPSPSSPRSSVSSPMSSPAYAPVSGRNSMSAVTGQPMYTFDGASNPGQGIPSSQDRLAVPAYIPQSFSGLVQAQQNANGMYGGSSAAGPEAYQMTGTTMGMPTPRQSFDSDSYGSAQPHMGQSTGLIKGPYVPSVPQQNLAYNPSYPPYHQPIPIAQTQRSYVPAGLPMGMVSYGEVNHMVAQQQPQQWIPAAQSFAQMSMSMGNGIHQPVPSQSSVKMESVSPKSTAEHARGFHHDDSDSEDDVPALPASLSRSSTSSKQAKPKTIKYRLKDDVSGGVSSTVVGQEGGELDLSNVILNPLGGGRGYVPGQTPDDPKKRHKCEVCGRGFARLFNLKSHQQTHDPLRPKPHNCPHDSCGRSFSRLHDLERHRQGIHSDGPLMVAKRHGISPSVARAQTRIAQRAERGNLV